MAYNSTVKSVYRTKTIDMLDDIYRKSGFRLKLDDLVRAKLGRGKSGDGLQSLMWWKEGKQQIIADYCKEDVSLTNELYEYEQKNGYIYYPSYGIKKSVAVNWKIINKN
jgi:DEAD/DEAH box helicase domain-containing protein